MNIPNTQRLPLTWSDTHLAEHAQKSLTEFVTRRLQEPRGRYIAHLKERRSAIERLFRVLSDIDPANPTPASIRAILMDNDLFSALRYVAGPPVSMDDLGVLVTRSTERLTKARIKTDDAITVEILQLICRVADPIRFPWIAKRRPPRPYEIKTAIRATVALHATQTLQTERRSYGKIVEKALENRLVAMEYNKVPPASGGKITAPRDYPKAREFYGECAVYGRKTDLLIGLEDGRVVAVEAKDSSSVVNSVKRVLNDTAAKARHWNGKAGEQIVPVALLSGVFGLENLKLAQQSGLYLVWTHDLDSFADWLAAQ